MKDVMVVTGGGGFIGHHLVGHLIADCKVVVLDNFSRGAPERLAKFQDKIIVRDCDVTDYEAVESSLKDLNVKTIFHLAAINGTGNFYKLPVEVMQVGVLGCINILEFARKFNVERVITASSAEVYQECDIVPTPEDVPLLIPDVKNPRYSYSLSKIFTEYYSYHFAVKNNMNVSIFRPHNVYGPDMGLQHVIPQFIMEFLRQIETSSDIRIQTKGSLDAVRAFCYVDDIIKGLEIISKVNNGVNVYNIGNTERVEMRQLLDHIAGIMNCEFSIESGVDTHIGGSMLRCPDISKMKGLGFSCEVSLIEGLERTVDWYKENFDVLCEINRDLY